MKTFRRIEVTAFRHRVSIVSHVPSVQRNEDTAEHEIGLKDADTLMAIEPDSVEGKKILIDVVRMLEQHLNRTSR